MSGGLNTAGAKGKWTTVQGAVVLCGGVFRSSNIANAPSYDEGKSRPTLAILLTLSNRLATWSNLSDLGFYPYGRTSGKC